MVLNDLRALTRLCRGGPTTCHLYGAPRGDARGGGIFDVAFPFGPEGPPGGPLVLQASKVTANRLNGTAGITLQGGGIYIQGEPITLTNSVITQNVPISASAANRERQATKRKARACGLL
jgi:hypothetical protein